MGRDALISLEGCSSSSRSCRSPPTSPMRSTVECGPMNPIEADLSGRTAVVTGATTGIGKQVARELARLGAHVIMPVRTPAKGQAAVDQITQETGAKKLELMKLDASSQASIRAFAKELAEKHKKLDILVNNAGGWHPERQAS